MAIMEETNFLLMKITFNGDCDHRFERVITV